MNAPRFTLIVDDCLEELARLPEASVDSCVCDPPYELGFMGKAWDSSGVAFDPGTWRAVLRVLKPGGYLLAFGGTRTYHRLACAVEDAGFEVRDMLSWLYGTGFPKSLDVSKAIDKQKKNRSEVLEVTTWIAGARDVAGLTNVDIDQAFGFHGMAGHWTSQKSQALIPRLDQLPPLLDLLDLDEAPERIRALFLELNESKGKPGPDWFRREVVGQDRNWGAPSVSTPNAPNGEWDVTAPATDEAREWTGWGTALKPACEPVVMARKPLEGTVAAGVLAYGTGAINVNASRINGETAAGRWPANVLLDEEAAVLLDDTGGASRFFYVTKPDRKQRDAGLDALPESSGGEATERKDGSDGLNSPRAGAGRKGGSKNIHATVKPIDLFRYLVRMVTPPGGLVLDPFAGSGTTGIAALLEGFRAHLIELDTAHACIAWNRLVEWESYDLPEGTKAKPRAKSDPRQVELL